MAQRHCSFLLPEDDAIRGPSNGECVCLKTGGKSVEERECFLSGFCRGR